MLEQVNKLVRFSKTPKLQLALFLSVLTVSAILYGGEPGTWRSVLLALAATIGSDYLFIRLRKLEPFFLSAAIVSGLIIGLLALPTLPWYYVVSAGILAMASKNFIKSNNRHVFNPAAFGLFIVGLLFHENVSWWGVIFQSFRLDLLAFLLFFILVSPAYISYHRLRRSNMILSFLFIFTLLQIFLRQTPLSDLSLTLSSVLLSPLVLFFSLVMLPEPMTSPNNSRLQIVFGSFVAVAAVAASFMPFFTPDIFLFALLTGNLIFFKLRQKYP